MKSFTINKIHIVLFEGNPVSYRGFKSSSYQINELLDEEGHTHFSHGPIGHAADMVYCPGTTTFVNRMLQKAHNLFEAKAALVEIIIEDEAQYKQFTEEHSFRNWFRKRGLSSKPVEDTSTDFRPLMRQLKDLPLLVGFFKGPATLKVFEEVLKNG
jgi:hypothetical protein